MASSSKAKKSKIEGKVIRDSFFTSSPDSSNTWICKCGTSRKQAAGGGYTNLVSHVKSEHPEGYKNLLATLHSSSGTPSTIISAPAFSFQKKAVQIHGWIDLIINGLLPYSTVTSDHFRRNIRHNPISIPCVSKYISLLTTRVEKKIQDLLPENFAIIFDGWTCSDTHYLAKFASFPYTSDLGYRTVLLSFSPFEDDTKQDALNHSEYLEYVLKLFKKSLANVVALIGDNCSTNKSFSTILDIPLIGCAIHRFNLFVNDLALSYEAEIQQVQKLMRKLKTQIGAAKLRELTELKAKTNIVTRWSSTYEMLERYQVLREFIMKIEDDVIQDLLPSSQCNKKIEEVSAIFSDPDSITKMLQSDTILLSTVRFLFDGVIKKIPSAGKDHRLTLQS